MTPTERAKRSDALYYETVSVNRRVLCDMIVNREADLEDAKAESEHMRLKALTVAGELQEENERLKAENAKLQESVKRLMTQRDERLARAEADNAKLRELVEDMHAALQAFCDAQDVHGDNCPLWVERTDDCELRGIERRMRELGGGRMSDVTTELAMEASDKAMEIARLKAENAKLREQIHWLKKGDILHVLTDQEYIDQCERERLMQVSIDALDKENAKLRELVEDMLDCIEIRAAFGRPPTTEMYETFYKRARELGVDE